MFSIKNDVKNEIIINKSKFITYLYYVENIEEIKIKLDQIRNEHKDASHYCYGYIINNSIKCSDDGEPSGTAGIPILNVLKNNDLENVICIVVRYFGGVKLGAGGLIRAYSKACKDSLNKSEIVTLKEGMHFEITFPYENNNQVDFILKDSNIVNKVFSDSITYEVIALKNIVSDLEEYSTITKIINTVTIK